MQSIVCSENLEENTFTLRDTPNVDLNRKYRPMPEGWPILADAKYLLCDNKTGNRGVVSGAQLFDVISVYDVKRFIPSVLARCTIIPL